MQSNRAGFPRGRFQFTLSSMMLLAAICAGLLGAWRAVMHQPVTHTIKLYEKAHGTKSLVTRVGQHELRIRSVMRNKRDGSVQIEDGHGHALTNSHIAAPPIPATAASWLDVAQIEFEPEGDQLEIIQSRIFDHVTRNLVCDLNQAFGWRMVQPHVLQLYGLGREIPETLDVWLRVNSYDPSDDVTVLSAKPGSTVEIEGGTLRVESLHPGYWAYDTSLVFNSGPVTSVYEFSVFLRWSGEWSGGDYQVVAVSKTGERVHSGIPDTMGFGDSTDSIATFYFSLPLDSIDHFEFRPYGGRHRLFFDGIRLPRVEGNFHDPPMATVPLGGQESELPVPEFAPLDVRLAARRGFWVKDVGRRDDRVFVRPTGFAATSTSEAFTMDYSVHGLIASPWRFRLLACGTENILPEAALMRVDSGQMSGTAVHAGFQSYQIPLEQIGAIEMDLIQAE